MAEKDNSTVSVRFEMMSKAVLFSSFRKQSCAPASAVLPTICVRERSAGESSPVRVALAGLI